MTDLQTAPLLATREALAEVLMLHLPMYDRCLCGYEPTDPKDYHRHKADALLASGIVRDPASLADDAALVEAAARAINSADDEALTRTNFEQICATYSEEARAVLRALAAALTEDPS